MNNVNIKSLRVLLQAFFYGSLRNQLLGNNCYCLADTNVKKKSHRQYHSSVRSGLLMSNNQYVKNTIYYSSILDSITPPCCVP